VAGLGIVLVAGCTGCLIAEPPDGTWRPLTSDCVPLAGEPTAVLRDEPYLHAFEPAGDTIVFDDDGGLSQLSLRDRERSLIVRTNADGRPAQFHAMENELVYVAWGARGGQDLVVDRGADVNPRWLTIASFVSEDRKIIHVNPAGVYWRDALDWHRWKRSTSRLVDSRLPHNASVTTDGARLFYHRNPSFTVEPNRLYTIPVDGGTPTLVAEAGDSTVPVGIGDARLFVWHRDPPSYLDEVTAGGLRHVTEMPELAAPDQRVFGGGYFYWGGLDSIMRVSLDGGDHEHVATIREGAIGTLKADACNVYWQVVREGATDLHARRH
jgi:hypothetical protein